MLKIIEKSVRENLDILKIQVNSDQMRENAIHSPKPKGFLSGFLEQKINIIAEIKKSSPSLGIINSDAISSKIAGNYLSNGACGISILTEKNYFHGSYEDLRSVRDHYPNGLLLMKDFVVDEYQIDLARYSGANAILLIMALLGPKKVAFFSEKALGLCLTPLIEVHDANEMQQALAMDAKFIGVNNRDLNSMKVCLETSEKLASFAQPGVTLISESGIKTGAQIERLRSLGYHGFLIGTQFMCAPCPGKALFDLLEDAKNAAAQ